jgi:hypothetical protein
MMIVIMLYAMENTPKYYTTQTQNAYEEISSDFDPQIPKFTQKGKLFEFVQIVNVLDSI